MALVTIPGGVVGSLLVFFFSSRRRHTRWTGDWSSDVCSSDLDRKGVTGPTLSAQSVKEPGANWKIGRASCRERVEISVVAVSLKKKNHAEPAGERGVERHNEGVNKQEARTPDGRAAGGDGPGG